MRAKHVSPILVQPENSIEVGTPLSSSPLTPMDYLSGDEEDEEGDADAYVEEAVEVIVGEEDGQRTQDTGEDSDTPLMQMQGA